MACSRSLSVAFRSYSSRRACKNPSQNLHWKTSLRFTANALQYHNPACDLPALSCNHHACNVPRNGKLTVSYQLHAKPNQRLKKQAENCHPWEHSSKLAQNSLACLSINHDQKQKHDPKDMPCLRRRNTLTLWNTSCTDRNSPDLPSSVQNYWHCITGILRKVLSAWDTVTRMKSVTWQLAISKSTGLMKTLSLPQRTWFLPNTCNPH